MAILSPTPKLQFFSANGVPLSGGKLYTYAAGTTTPQTSYTDSTGNVANPNPIILDSRGEANVWLNNDVYKFKLTTSNDVDVWTIDNIAGALTANSLVATSGASLIGFIQAGTGAVARTVQSKLRDIICPRDFGAVGNGTTNDTSAFAALEGNVTGENIDLQNLTYLVTAVPTGNTYFNGYFKVGSTTTRASGDFKLFGVKAFTPLSAIRDSQNDRAKLRYVLTRIGTSPNNVNQSIAVDEVNGYLYEQHVSTTFAPPDEASVICRYDLYGNVYQTAIDSSVATTSLGHQGLAVEYLKNNDTKLWSAAPYGTGNGTKACRFEYTIGSGGANSATITNIETYQLFPTDTSSQATSPTISYDQRYLLVEKNATVNGVSGNMIRVFDLAELRDGGPGDYSNQFITEFFVSVTAGTTPTVGFQTMVCDGQYVYIQCSGNSISEPHTFAVYDLQGNFVAENRDYTVGRAAAALDGAGTLYEQEGSALMMIGGTLTLLSAISSGDVGARQVRVYGLGAQVVENEFSVPPNSSMVFNKWSGSTGYVENARFDDVGNLRAAIGVNTVNASVTSATYDSKSLSTNAEDNTPQGIFFKPDGKMVFVVGDSNNRVYQYNLTTPWDVSTGSYASVSFLISAQVTDPRDIYFRTDGLRFYVLDNATDSVYEYTMSTAWDISTAAYSTKFFSIATQEDSAGGLYFKPDGLAMFVAGQTNDKIWRYNLSTAWDVTTAVANSSMSIEAEEPQSYSLTFTNDGAYMLVVGRVTAKVTCYSLSTPWTITTIQPVSSFSVASQEATPGAIFLRQDCKKLYVEGTTNDTIYQYSLPGITNYIAGATEVVGNVVFNDNINLPNTFTPAAASSPGTKGQIVWDSSYVYVCVATNTWKRASIATW